MLKLEYYNNKTKLPKVDYVLDKPEKLSDLVVNLTPKFEGQWEIILLDPKITQVNEIIETNVIPDWITLYIYVNNAKMEKILLEHPTFAPQQVSVKETFKLMIAELHNSIETKAMYDLYDAVGANVQALQEALNKLDAECEGGVITVKQVHSSYTYTKHVYASEVLEAFLTKDKQRWYKFDRLTHELGDTIAYYALRKQVTMLLRDKNKYLHNVDVKSTLVTRVDAPYICYVYTLFANSSSPSDLRGLMYCIENRNEKVLQALQS